jgi:thymidylate kinase
MGCRRLICFTGVDGSGKSTHAKALFAFLKENGFNCEYVWGASRPFLSYPFFALTRVLGYWKITKENTYTDPLEFAPKRVARKLAVLYRFLLFLDFQIKTTTMIRIPMLLGRAIVCDRYFYDLLMDLKRSDSLSNEFLHILSGTLPQPLLIFLMDAPENLVHERRGFQLKELIVKRQIYLKMAKTFDFCIFDSSKDFWTNQNSIRRLTLKHIS